MRWIDIARSFGYKDDSAITHMLNRLKKDAESNPDLRKRHGRSESPNRCQCFKFQRAVAQMDSRRYLDQFHGFQTFKTPSKKIKTRHRSFMSVIF